MSQLGKMRMNEIKTYLIDVPLPSNNPQTLRLLGFNVRDGKVWVDCPDCHSSHPGEIFSRQAHFVLPHPPTERQSADLVQLSADSFERAILSPSVFIALADELHQFQEEYHQEWQKALGWFGQLERIRSNVESILGNLAKPTPAKRPSLPRRILESVWRRQRGGSKC